MSKKIYEGYGPQEHNLKTMLSKDPYVFNSDLHLVKYRITIETIDAPQEEIEERLRDLWEKKTNYHHTEHLLKAAEDIGVDLRDPP